MKTALVTGGTSGIGLATVEALVAKGYTVYATSVRSAQAGLEMEESSNGAIRYVQADVTDKEHRNNLYEVIENEVSGLDVLVNNAGYTKVIPHRDLEGASDDVWAKILDTNLMGTWWMCKEFYPLLGANGGCIINVTSIAGIRPTGSSIPYAVSKAAINHLTTLLAASFENGVRVNAVAPGLIDTPWTKDWEQIREHVGKTAPLKRSGQPKDVATVICSIIDATYMTGQVITVDGGLTLK
ncbi:SDR family NAD(P)-dependent oxidoreductase [Acidithrix ferrooxidans]|uniref:3-oxoacyl-[acyl-carrier-protein] reductase FabG n=1 Tax=Acidithrix ferrooxidans TaxID=1280514 RepID=A0A0D8HEB5_9ACTN|nr:SDR family oxidoreductase [Acidithrix ferrooxidans]KJF16305.1 3-oxoacyl-[acyl-carrier-protein] reductase FabG [Acidithrix ferrooxidans]